MFILVAYDILNAKRRRRMAALMEDYGARRQLSIFECSLDKDRLDELIHKIKEVIRRREDKVQIYHLCQACRERFGRYSQPGIDPDPDIYIC
jgi:CRISPR-associated protein Cas2